ncbi:carboxymuconolactone decarboxylase family protein [Microbulbifer echini]|uniref:Carboxymuconolactone decarboxylase family protein n=1 Tax=Microbulbifer echini TaxID=1529067 RepID=A0ABV4NR01_9GAMM|nr:carboxymuconolactone decarboxylase family protein [uncultured Microbulbifer sp.]
MKEFQVYDLDSAPEGSKPLLQKSIKAFGSIPNLHGVMAESPQALAAYQDLHQHFIDSSFNAEEMTVVWQTINVEHNCHYCVPAHSAIAKAMKVDDAINEALRNKTPLPTKKLEVLRDTTLAIVRERGVVSDQVLERFYGAGYNRQNMLDIIVGVAQKVMSNYINHLADTPVDAQFVSFVR